MFLVASNSETKYTVAPTLRRCSNTFPLALFGRFWGRMEPAKNPCAVLLNVRRVPVKDSFSAEKTSSKKHDRPMRVQFYEITLAGLGREDGSAK